MTVWTIDPTAVVDGDIFCSVNGGDGDPHDIRHFPSQTSALHFLLGNKMRYGDVLMVAGEINREIDIRRSWHGQQLCYDVGTHEISTPEELIRYLDGLLQPGDTVRYLHN